MDRIVEKLSRVPCSGLLLGSLSGVFLATSSFIVTQVNVNPVEVVGIRCLIQTIVFLPFGLISGSSLFGVEGERLKLLWRGIIGFILFSLTYISFHLIPLADASTIVFSSSVFVFVLAWIILREEFNLFHVCLLILTITGVVLVSRPPVFFGQNENEDPVTRVAGVLVAIGASLSIALSIIAVRQLTRTPTIIILTTMSVIITVCSFFSLLTIKTLVGDKAGLLSQDIYFPTKKTEILLLLANGVCGLLGQTCITMALKLEEAGLVSLTRTIDVPTAFVFQIFFLKNQPIYWTSVAGAVIICVSVMLGGIKRWLSKRPEKWEVFWVILNCGHKPRDENLSVEIRETECQPNQAN